MEVKVVELLQKMMGVPEGVVIILKANGRTVTLVDGMVTTVTKQVDGSGMISLQIPEPELDRDIHVSVDEITEINKILRARGEEEL